MGALLGAVLLWLGAGLGALAFMAETCTGNSPDSLAVAPLVLVLNLLGFAALGWSSRLWVVGLVAAVPALAALHYSFQTVMLAGGVPACDLITGESGWEQTPDHAGLAMLWVATALSFWLGLAGALWRGTRRRADKDILT
ncbi:hypothetical protein [Erythrobacter colymbi]|uniref:hypothetical protein n=1 Tax=Erythrobacter colymbi TaxID=1161202 RepID=UPI000A37B2B8|nr:hypothetical protein [Erythrobacter colymbi]